MRRPNSGRRRRILAVLWYNSISRMVHLSMNYTPFWCTAALPMLAITSAIFAFQIIIAGFPSMTKEYRKLRLQISRRRLAGAEEPPALMCFTIDSIKRIVSRGTTRFLNTSLNP
jgi:hypothetical protein